MEQEQGAHRGLFRPEALAAQLHPALGSIQVNTPPAFWAVSLLGTCFIIAAAAYLALGHYTRRATADGMLVPAAGLVTLTAKGAGEVVRVSVRQGERVAAGQPLAEFDNPLDSAALGNTLRFIRSELDSQRKGLQQDLITQRALSASQATALRASIASLRAQLVEATEQLDLQRKEASAASTLLTRITPLSKQGFVSVYDLQQQQTTAFNAELQVKALLRERMSIQQQLSQTEQQLQQIPLTLVAQQNDVRGKLAEVEQAFAQNEAQRAWVLNAPRAGIVSTLLIKPGQTVMAGQPLLTVLPAGSVLEAQLLVPSSAIGFVRSGHRVVLRYQAFPYQNFGLHFGEVDQISRNALLPSEVAVLVGEPSAVPLYRVLVRLNGQSVQAYGRSVALRPGLALEADILLDRRRLIEWIMEPLYGFTRRIVVTPSPQRSRI